MKRAILVFLILALAGRFLLPATASAEEIGVEVGGIHILKTDVTGNPLEGAVFQLVKEAEAGELTDHILEKQILKIGDENRFVSVMTFWADRDMEGKRQQEVTTDHNGAAAIYGLPYGTYYLVEKQAPQGYNRISSPIRVSIHKYSHLTETDQVLDDQGKVMDHTLHIINVRYALPDTGNWGRIQLAVAAAGILSSSAALILLNRRRRDW